MLLTGWVFSCTGSSCYCLEAKAEQIHPFFRSKPLEKQVCLGSLRKENSHWIRKGDLESDSIDKKRME